MQGPKAYVCQDFACQAPTADPEAVKRALRRFAAPATTAQPSAVPLADLQRP